MAPSNSTFAALVQSRWLYLLASLPLLGPCFWQDHIQAGDLSSHIYNSWLAQLIETTHLQGLEVAGQTTNILFDLILSGLFRTVGAAAAQRIAVAAAVLVFVWGAFAFARVVSGRTPWHILPCIAMLAYGWVFHMGFFDFYLSLGLCFWGLSLLWNADRLRVAIAVPLFVLAYLAHALPFAWAVALAIYVQVFHRFTAKARTYLLFSALLALIVLHAVMGSTMTIRWSGQQLTMMAGIDQAWVYDGKYFGVVVALLLVWCSLFLTLARSSSMRQVVSSPAFHLCVISAAGVFILPTTVLVPGFKHALVFIAERMSLCVGICLCALFAGVRPRAFEQYAMTLVALLFFVFLYHDERALNIFEDRVHDTVAALPPGQRVISAIDDPNLRVNALAHVVDRACLGHCYSYANYEPSTAQFRVRAVAENAYVAYTYEDSWLLQVGGYVVKDRDLPLYQVDLDSAGRMGMKNLRAGDHSGNTPIKVIGDLF